MNLWLLTSELIINNETLKSEVWIKKNPKTQRLKQKKAELEKNLRFVNFKIYLIMF